MTDSRQGNGAALLRPRRLRYQDLMRRRVEHILLVSSLYDSFILTEDGQLNEVLLRQFLDLNLIRNPDLTRVSTGGEALEVAGGFPRFDLIITSMRLGDMDAVEFAGRIRNQGLYVPVYLLAFNNRDLTEIMGRDDTGVLDGTFLWQGDNRILLAMVKQVEDRMNVAHDTGIMGVPAIIVVEDNPRFWSSFLPVIYSELVLHTRGLLSEGLNLAQKMLRLRARPKVLHCETYEEAWSYFTAYEEQIMGIISDVEFPRDGELDRSAGAELARRVREVRSDIPIVLQSSREESRALADSIRAPFLLKGSPLLLHDLRRILVESFGFGEFVFRLPDGREIDRARDLPELTQKLQTVPAESIAYHSARNHFSCWLRARTELALAQDLRPRTLADYESVEHVREDLVQSMQRYRHERDRVIVADFLREAPEILPRVSRIGGGSLGGKARGLAFANRLFIDAKIDTLFPQVRVWVPEFTVVGTDVFDRFMEDNDLHDFAVRTDSEEEIERRFLEGDMPEDAVADLKALLRATRYPIAVRSSGLLEDLPEQPFAGIYQTYMLANNEPDPGARLDALLTAIKKVYASTFSRRAKAFLRMTPYRLEEEKMAVIIQRVVGTAHGDRFYPDFGGVARSRNFYPTPPLKAEDGIVAVAMGLGSLVVEGGRCLRFCPKYPQHLVGFSSVDEILENSQREFVALDLTGSDEHAGSGPMEGMVEHGLEVGEEDGTLNALASTYSHDNRRVTPGTSRPGLRLVTFAPILQHGRFPLAEVMTMLLETARVGTREHVEIEFAVNLSVEDGALPELGFLQMRPLPLTPELEELEIGEVPPERLLVRSDSVLGNGRLTDLCDVVVVGAVGFDRLRSREAADEVGRLNGILEQAERPYLLVGVGRWGSADPHLGIPVAWDQITGARVIVEAGFQDMKVTPSQGTHFFQNLASTGVGYFTVNPEAGEGEIDWGWLALQPAVEETEFVRHIRLDAPLEILMDGRRGEGVVLKP